MIEKDTVRLLRECSAGVKMGVDSINDVLGHVRDRNLMQVLNESRKHHEDLETEIQAQLSRFKDDTAQPPAMAKAMSKMKTAFKLTMDDGDDTVADLITDGCGMGVKSLSQYLNQYKAADETSKDIAKRLITIEEQLEQAVRPYL